jgi:hypothetical protein
MDDFSLIIRVLGLRDTSSPIASFIKPHGRKLADGKLIVWSKAIDWKLTLLALYERNFGQPATDPYAAILLQASTKHSTAASRLIVEDVAMRLGIKRVVWLD